MSTAAWRRATATVCTAAKAGLVAAVGLAACGGSDDEPSGSTLPADPDAIVAASAAAMGDVESVRFEVTPTGAPVYIDQFESISIDRIVGEFTVPRSAQAVLDVEVGGSLTTQLAAVAVDEEVWLSNPVTGTFETLPEGYDLDPSRFFDPEDGWRPLLAELDDVELVAREDRGGDRYRVRGTSAAEQVCAITAGLVCDQDVVIDFWIQPVTALVRTAEFTTELGDGTVDWLLELDDYGESFDISAPEDVS